VTGEPGIVILLVINWLRCASTHRARRRLDLGMGGAPRRFGDLSWSNGQAYALRQENRVFHPRMNGLSRGRFHPIVWLPLPTFRAK